VCVCVCVCVCRCKCKCRRVFVFTDLLNTPVLVNTQHNHWTVTCQIRAYPVHYTTHTHTHTSLSFALSFSLYRSDTFLSRLFSLNVPLSPTSHITPVFFLLLFLPNHTRYPCTPTPFLAALCLIIMVSNVSMYPCRWGKAAAAA